jgi:hypothetical protein
VNSLKPTSTLFPASGRRTFLRQAAVAAGAVPLLGHASVATSTPAPGLRGSCAQDEDRVRFFSPAIKQPFSITMVADTHLFRDDDRGVPYREYSARMAKAYNTTKHFKTGAALTPEQAFRNVLASARAAKSELFAMIGDIVSFPSEAAVGWVCTEVADAGLPTVYTAGNHDWHYEGMEGTSAYLRATWIEKRLLPLYRGQNPMIAAHDIKGVRFLVIDNSTYEIERDQLVFFQSHAATGVPLVLMVHIPLYAPGRPIGFGCGHPEWGASADKSYQIEKRPRWRADGHTAITREFHRAVFSCPSLLGVFAGHTHKASTDIMNGIPQFVADANFRAASMTLEFVPAPPA